MLKTISLAALLLASSPLLAQDDAPADNPAAEDRHVVAADNNWSLTDSECLLDAGWDDEATIMVNRHGEHYDLGLYNPNLTKVADQKVVPVRFGAGGTIVTGREYVALGHRNGETTAYVSDVDEALLDRIAEANSFQFFRGKTLLADLDMTGFKQALVAMRACEAAKPSEPLMEDGTEPDDPFAPSAESAAAAAEAASADAVQAFD